MRCGARVKGKRCAKVAYQVQDLFIGKRVRPSMHFDPTAVFDDGKEFLVGFGLCRLRGQIGGVLFQERP